MGHALSGAAVAPLSEDRGKRAVEREADPVGRRRDPAARAAVLALLQRTDLVAVGHLAGPLSALEDLLREAGPHYDYLCGPSDSDQIRTAVLYDTTRLTPSGVADLAKMPGWSGPRPYITELRPDPAAPHLRSRDGRMRGGEVGQ